LIETINNEYGKQYIIKIELPFRNICAMSHLPDNGMLIIKYIPAKLLIELISLRGYLTSFHDKEVIQEQFTSNIYTTVKARLEPVSLQVSTKTNIQATEGGILTIKFGDF
jgi:7-cyano-7-deazaguanine reductase